ncbi:flagellar motor protein MotB [Gemmobacter sp.]|uniref:flagellar motor protein MotB n=1 Tax=Gemmobacter sp. TaxID=1898957 RepID=UPI002AFE34BC|nr:flagellar motor protein MotB [Gemmobacter sp.]
MARPGNAAPVIIKRKKVSGEHAHHGGAWKVAYADFVTAMMAFFLLMWLLNATTEKQRKGIADYFNPVVPVNRISGGGDGAFGGESLFSEQVLAQSGTGASATHPTEERQAMGVSGDAAAAAEQRALQEIDAALKAVGGESMTMERLMRHVVSRLTDEGLVVELFDLPDSPLFDPGTDTARPVLKDLLRVVADSFAMVGNQLAVQGFVQSYPITLIENPAWDLSAARAQATRVQLQRSGFEAKRIQRVSGYADRQPAVPDPMASRNNRLELVLLRQRR